MLFHLWVLSVFSLYLVPVSPLYDWNIVWCEKEYVIILIMYIFVLNKQDWKQNKFWILFCIKRIFFKPAIASVHGIPDVV